jgi:hypothetical protein
VYDHRVGKPKSIHPLKHLQPLDTASRPPTCCHIVMRTSAITSGSAYGCAEKCGTNPVPALGPGMRSPTAVHTEKYHTNPTRPLFSIKKHNESQSQAGGPGGASRCWPDRVHNARPSGGRWPSLPRVPGPRRDGRNPQRPGVGPGPAFCHPAAVFANSAATSSRSRGIFNSVKISRAACSFGCSVA